MAFREFPRLVETQRPIGRSAVWMALLLLQGTAGCLNWAAGELEVPLNQVPVIVSVFPEPSFDPVQVNVGKDCRPETFRLDNVDDADLDVLTVRWHLLLNREGTAVRERVGAARLTPLPNPAAGQHYQPVSLSLDFNVFNSVLGASGIRDQAASNVFQLVEVRVSDDGFAEGDDDFTPNEGAGVAFRTWQMKLLNNDCSVTP